MCENLAAELSRVCDVIETIEPVSIGQGCAALAVAIDVGTFPSGEAAPIFAACEAVGTASKVICATLGASPGTPGTPSLADRLCLAIPINRAPGDTVSIRPFAIIRSPEGVKTLYGDGVNVPPEGPFPELTVVDSTSKPNIVGGIEVFRLKPEDTSPRVRQGIRGIPYRATVEVDCVVAGTPVEITVDGSDGYKNFKRYTATNPGYHQFTIEVPYANVGVREVITATLYTPSFDKISSKQHSFVWVPY